jgi:hypothetical protein
LQERRGALLRVLTTQYDTSVDKLVRVQVDVAAAAAAAAVVTLASAGNSRKPAIRSDTATDADFGATYGHKSGAA